MRVLARGLKSSLGSGWVLVIGGVTFTPSAWVWNVLLPGFGWERGLAPCHRGETVQGGTRWLCRVFRFPTCWSSGHSCARGRDRPAREGTLESPADLSAGPGRGLSPVSSFLGLGPRPAPQHLHRQPGPVRDGHGCRPHGQWHQMPSHQQGTHGRVPGSTQGQSLCCFKAEEMQGLRRSTSLPCV